MKNSNRVNNRGVTLVAAIAIMLILGMMGAALVSMIGTTSRGAADYVKTSQAFAIAQAGINWYMMRLAGVADWDGEADQSGISLNPGTFDIAISNQASPHTDSATSTRMDIAVTGNIAGPDGVTIQRTMSQRVWKLPSASKFALFWGRDSGALNNFDNVTIVGDVWASDDMNNTTNSTISRGSVYHPNGVSIEGLAETTSSAPTPSMPTFDASYYTGLIAAYNTMIDNDPSSSDVELSSNLALSGNTLNYRDFNTNGTITISGYGYIVSNRDMGLHSRNGDSGTLTITSSGGSIVFLAARDLTVNSTQADTTINASSGIRMYSRSQTSTGQLLRIRNNTTNIDDALILANRRIIVQSSANLTNCTLFVNNNTSSASNNRLVINDAGTSVGTLAGPCSLISMGRDSPSLQVTDTASICGLIIQLGSGDLDINGTSSVNRISITGSIVANQVSRFREVNVTYDPSAIPDPPPEGFNGYVTKKPDSWTGN